jgi:beta-ureidopropionase / N-carbamoyl-L-amino-acid hydrolase
VRAYDEAVLSVLEENVRRIIAGIEQRRGVRFHLPTTARAAVGSVDQHIKAGLEASGRNLGMPVLHIGSPASHDAAAFAAAGIPVGMIFVRNENGSHNPCESMKIDDFLDGTAILIHWLINSAALGVT